MQTNSKRKLLFTTIMLAALLISSAYATLIPNVEAAELPIQGELPFSLPEVNMTRSAIEEKGLPILSNVLGLDMAKYATTSKEGPQDSYMDVVPQENVHYTLESGGRKLGMLCTFANGNLRMLNVLESEGAPYMTKVVTKPLELGNVTLQVVDLPETAKGFLSDYESYSGNSFYGELGSMLENVDGKGNVTKISGNVKLEVTKSEGSTVFRWMYTANGLDAPSKCVALGYKNGFFKYFIDNWALYKIGSTSVNVSEQEAIDIAMERARAFSWNMGSDNDAVKISGFTVTNAMIWENVFCSNLYADEARSEDPLMLYPVRHVWVSLDKFYPGNVYGFNVYVWADTGVVCAINERFSTLDPPADLVATTNDFTVESLSDSVPVDEAKSSSLSLRWIALPAFAAVMLGTVPVWLLLSKKKNLPKRRVFKVGGVLLCLLISSLLLLPISAVSAYPTRRALIWGSESTGAWNTTLGYSWRKHPDEVSRQGNTATTISNYFKDDGYDTKNYQGEGSIKYCILGNITDAETNYSKVAVVDFDHGVYYDNYMDAPGEFHYMFEDNYGLNSTTDASKVDSYNNHMVYDMDIYEKTTGKTFFAFINTCLSANTTYGNGDGTYGAVGMPYAWTGRTVSSNPGSGEMSDDGYSDPDGGTFCYIGFPWGSAALNQTITGVAPIYAQWLENFFWYVLSFDISVNDALDEASLSNFDELFGETDLATDFIANWPRDSDGDGEWEDCFGQGSAMAVYGNGNIHLYEYFVHDYVFAGGVGVGAWVENPDGIEGGSNDNDFTSLYAVGYYGDKAGITSSIGWEATGQIYLYCKTYPGLNSHVMVYVSYDYENWDIVDECLWVSHTSWNWFYVGSYSGDFRYISIMVYADHYPSVLYVDSVLVIPSPSQSSPHYWVANTTYYVDGGSVVNHENLTGSFPDGDFAYIYCGNPPDMAQIYGSMNREASGQVEVYGKSYSGYYSDLYVYVSDDYENWDQVGDKVTVTSTSPYWIDFGPSSGSFLYIAVVGYDNANSVKLYLDSVRVTP
jgi:hypothetical protein